MRIYLSRLWRACTSILTQHMTVKVIPENTSEGFSFRLSTLVLLFVAVFSATILGGGVYLLRVRGAAPETLSLQHEELRLLQANLDQVIMELQTVVQAARPVSQELEYTFAGFTPLSMQRASPANLSRLQLSDFQRTVGFRDTSATGEALMELLELQELLATMEGSMDSLGEVGGLFESKQQFLRDVPHFWPVENGLGIVTMEYGPNVHPFTGQWYMHKGFDIAGPIGLPLVAAADGTVTDVGFDTGYGNFIIIRHRWGFHTKYAHMHQVGVRIGQQVRQGQRIGTLGSSGFSTGSHLHFEVIIGGEVLDPAPFLQISNTFQRGGHASTRRR